MRKILSVCCLFLVLSFNSLALAEAAPSKKTTITCFKDALTKKVTAVTPKCPSGYVSKPNANVQHEVLINSFQWSWQFTYLDAGKDVKVSGTSDNPPTMVIPLGKRVRFTVESNDVVHGFWIPAFMIQIEARPGVSSRQEITANKLGDFPGRCNILCGREHSQMLFTVRVVTPTEYKAYVANLKSATIKASPTATATPPVSITPSPMPSAINSATSTVTPTQSATTTATVSPGAFCTPAGALGTSKSGVAYTCKSSATDTRNRWRL